MLNGKNVVMPKSLKTALLGLAVLTLTGCAHTQMSALSHTGASAGAPAPEQILVEISTAPQGSAAEATDVNNAAAGMQTALLQKLAKQHVAAAIYNPALDQPGVLVLHAVIASADPGSAAARLAVGFGAGASQLQMNVFVRPGGAAPGSEQAFNLSSKSGAKPGLILPAGIAIITHNPWHMAIGGAIDLATSRRTGVSPAEASAAAKVVEQLKGYYAAQGWSWPGETP